MAYRKATQLKAWSFSSYNLYKQCPLKLKLQKIDKIPEPGSPALERGSAIHDKAEDYIKGEGRIIPKELKEFEKLFKRLRKRYQTPMNGMIVEDMWAMTKTWESTHWKDWTGCWVRIKLDCAESMDEETKTILHVYDWKTGKFRPENNETYLEQLELYALGALLERPDIDEVRPQLVYLDVGTTYPGDHEDVLVYTRKDIPKLKKLWERRVKPMMNDKIFAPRPNHFCSWCHYRKSNKENGGGQCKY